MKPFYLWYAIAAFVIATTINYWSVSDSRNYNSGTGIYRSGTGFHK